MTKSELVALVADKAGLTKKDAEAALNAVVASISEAVVKGDKVSLVGFGSFEARKRAAKTCKIPQTGATIKVAATTVPVFKAGKGFKDAVAGK